MNPHQFPLTPLAKGLLAVLLGVAAPMVQALTLNAGTQAFDFSKAVTDTEIPGSSAVIQGNAIIQGAGSILNFQQFDPLVGQLKRVNFGLTSTLSVSSATSATYVAGGSYSGMVNASGFASAQPNFSLPGAPFGGNMGLGSNIPVGSACSGLNHLACSSGSVSAQGSYNKTLSTGDSMPGGTFSGLASYTGTGTVALMPHMDVMVNQFYGVFNGVESTTGTARWQGAVSLSYDYDLHALASFGTTANTVTALTLDFGTLYKGDAALGQSFQISNWSGSSERVALQLDGVDATGDFTRFETNLSGFSNLNGGTQFASQAGFDTSELGDFEANYILRFSDAGDPSLDAYSAQTLLLTLKGSVTAPVPEPETYALMLVGSGLVGLQLRRKRKVISKIAVN